MNWIKRAWRWSRTVFLNVIAAILPLLGEIVSYLAGVDWTSITQNPRVALAYTIGLTVLNIFLRFITTKPVGEKAEEA